MKLGPGPFSYRLIAATGKHTNLLGMKCFPFDDKKRITTKFLFVTYCFLLVYSDLLFAYQLILKNTWKFWLVIRVFSQEEISCLAILCA